MRSLGHLLLAAALAALLGGCHARFKREAPSLGAVKTQAFSAVGPHVVLGKLNDDGIVGLVVNTVQTGKEYEVRRRIRSAVKITDVNYALQVGVAESLGDGPPFAYTDADPAGATLQLEILNWGLEVPYLGAQGDFHYDVRTRIYKADGRLVYKSRARCSTGAGNPQGFEIGIGTVNNVAQIRDMTDEQIQHSFDEVARWCGYEVVRKMRQHAG